MEDYLQRMHYGNDGGNRWLEFGLLVMDRLTKMTIEKNLRDKYFGQDIFRFNTLPERENVLPRSQAVGMILFYAQELSIFYFSVNSVWT